MDDSANYEAIKNEIRFMRGMLDNLEEIVTAIMAETELEDAPFKLPEETSPAQKRESANQG